MNSFGVVPIPPLFWQVDLRVPKPYGNDFNQQVQAFRQDLAELKKQEASGLVDRSAVLSLLIDAWALRNSYRLPQDRELYLAVLGIREVAKKYGLSKVWRARYHNKLIDTVNDACASSGSRMSVYHCGVCGRQIWVALSVQRGIGPICYSKLGR
jgi:hypothetical protein